MTATKPQPKFGLSYERACDLALIAQICEEYKRRWRLEREAGAEGKMIDALMLWGKPICPSKDWKDLMTRWNYFISPSPKDGTISFVLREGPDK